MDPKEMTEQDLFLANDFVKFLRQHDHGNLAVELEKDLHGLVKAVRKIGKKGEIKLTIKVEPNDDDVEMVSVDAQTSVTLPRPKIPKRTYFPTVNGGVSRHHPDQLSIDGI